MSTRITPVILSGGSGSRLWPLSRKLLPKQFLPLHSGKTMFQETALRIVGAQFNDPLTVCNEAHRFMVAGQLLDLGITSTGILLEPEARNTAPAIAAAARVLLDQDPEALMLVLASDHVIADVGAFHQSIEIAAGAARAGHLATFGITPTHPETGYGYIRAAEGEYDYKPVAQFVEKPDTETAISYLEAGNYFWNSGSFLFRADVFLQQLEIFEPEIVRACDHAVAKAQAGPDFTPLDPESYITNPAISIDYAVMERTEKAVVVPLDAGWSDIGSWTALHQNAELDTNGNVSLGDTFIHNSRNSYVRSEKRLTAVVGVDDLMIVATDDAVMVAHRDHAQDVKLCVDWLEQQDRSEHVAHSTVYRPWGHYSNIDEGPGFLVKQIVIKPGAKLSLQYHNHRSEHWIVVAGTALVTNGDQALTLHANQSTYIPIGVQHRLENQGDVPLRLIEVQVGELLSEEDIVRTEDAYGRA